MMKFNGCTVRRFLPVGQASFRFERASFSVLLTLCVFLSSAVFAQSPSDTQKTVFGTFQQDVLDLEVKVQGGSIRVWRRWRGDELRWEFNPQHAKLGVPKFATRIQTSLYPRPILTKLQKGLREFWINESLGIYERQGEHWKGSWTHQASRNGGYINGLIQQHGIKACARDEPLEAYAREVIHVTGDTFRLTESVNGEWSSYDIDHRHLLEWGVKDQVIGRALYDGNRRLTGYADAHGQQVIFINYNDDGHISSVEDYSGRKVLYDWQKRSGTTRVELAAVTDPDGIVTTYAYGPKNELKTIATGDPEGTTGTNAGEGTRFTIGYDSKTFRYTSILDDDGQGVHYQHVHLKQGGAKLRKETLTGGRTITYFFEYFGYSTSVSVNDIPVSHTVKRCEDTITIDRFNRVTYYDRDGYFRLRRIIRPDGSEVTYHHSEFWPEIKKPWDRQVTPWGVTGIESPNGATVGFTLDKGGRPLSATEDGGDGTSRLSLFEYDSFGNRTKEQTVTGAAPNEAEDFLRRYSYDEKGNVNTFTNAKGGIWTFEYNALGQVIKVTDPNNNERRWEYTPAGRIKSVRTARGYEQHYEYTKRGLVKRYTERYEVGKEATWEYFWDRHGRITRIVAPDGGARRYEYDGNGDVRRERDEEGAAQSWQYYADGRLQSYVDQRGIETKYEYDDGDPAALSAGTPVFPLVREIHPTYTKEQRYDLLGRVVSQKLVPKTGESLLTTYKYDALGRLTTITRPDTKTVIMVYDGLGWLKTSTAPGWGTSTVEYHSAKKTIVLVDPLGGRTEYQFDGDMQVVREKGADNRETSYAYNKDGTLLSVTNGKGRVFQYGYTPDRELLHLKVYPSVNADTPSRTIEYSYNLRGDELGVRDEVSTHSYTRDALGQLLETSIDFGPFTKNHGYTYRKDGLRKTYRAPDGVMYRYDYEGNGAPRLIEIEGVGAITYRYTQNDSSQPEAILYPGGVSENFQYDDLRRIKRITARDRSGGQILDLQYTWKNGIAIEKIASDRGEYKYKWDEAYRVTEADTPWGKEQYTYDELGNLRPFGENWEYTATGGVKTSSLGAFAYDAEGNRATETGAQTREYLYDDSEKLIEVRGSGGTVLARYRYDPDGWRISKEVSGVKTYFYHTEDGLSAEFDSDGTLIRSYLYDPEAPWGTAPMMIKTPQEAYFPLKDHLGTPQKIVDQNGNVRWSALYSAYGKATVTRNDIENPLRLPGQYYDSETGLYQNGMRYYDSNVGEYTSHDPFSVPLSGFNRYGYVYGRPITTVDPTGEFIPAIVIGGGVVVGSFGVVADVLFTAAVVYGMFEIIPWLGEQVWGQSEVLADYCKALPIEMVEPDEEERPHVTPQDEADRQRPEPQCRPCDPPVGTIGQRVDLVPPSRPHWPHTGSHTTLYVMQQSPPRAGCRCFWHPIGSIDGTTPPPGSVPMRPAGGGGLF